MNELQYVSVDRILSKLHRDIKETNLNETDVIEWIGEALEFLKVHDIQEQALAFLEVKNYEGDIPKGFQMVIQIAKNNSLISNKTNACELPKEILSKVATCEKIKPDTLNCERTLYRHNFDLKWEYQPFSNTSYYKSNFTPVRLGNNTLYNTLVCKEKNLSVYEGSEDEYTIVGLIDKKLRFSFKEGYVIMSYLRNALDEETGYPLIPDNISFVTAIGYYVKWKLSEWYQWSGRGGYDGITKDAEAHWLKYVRQAKNWAKMPKSLDDYQDLLEQTHQIVPRHKRYYGFFGKIKR